MSQIRPVASEAGRRQAMTRPRHRAARGAVAVLVLLVMSTGASASASAMAGVGQAANGAGSRAVSLRYTEYGIPHILAQSWEGLGYGDGYGQARDTICTLAEAYVTVDGDRSRYFGPDGSYVNGGSSLTPVNNLDSDLFYRQMDAAGTVEKAISMPAPRGPEPEVRNLVRGFVAGYNRYLSDTGVQRLPDPTCRGADWVHPITELEAYRRISQILLLGSSGNAIDGVGSAQPPVTAQTAAQHDGATPQPMGGTPTGGAGSNGIAIGGFDTANRRGLLLANPHFPWAGAQRFWQAQETVPGQVDASGAAPLGFPLPVFGHNASVAWTHTVATYRPFSLYQLSLVPGDPTSYMVDGHPERMQSRTISVPVRRSDGQLTSVSRTLYSTRYGSVIAGFNGVPTPLTWTAGTAYAMRDANLGQLRGLNLWYDFARARGTIDLLRALYSTQGAPFVNTIATDNRGLALFGSIGVTANISDAKAAACNTGLGQALFPASGIAVLDGSRTSCGWDNDPGTLEGGTISPYRMPFLLNGTYVTNHNDSPWLTNPETPLSGYPRIIGNVAAPRTLRTREGLLQVQAQLAAGKFTPATMQSLLFSDDVLAGHLAAADTARMCSAFPAGVAPSSAGPVKVGDACAAVASWDQHANLDSRGALLFFRFWERMTGAGPTPWKVAFDPTQPLTTPNTLDTTDPRVQRAFGDAVNDLRAAAIPFDAPLGQFQYVDRESGRIPLHGGPESVGVLNKLAADWDPQTGYSDVTYRSSSSFIMVVSFNGTPCPDASTLLTYGQSTNPTSPHSDDQTRLFSQKQLVPDRFCARDIQASPQLNTLRLAWN